MDAIILARHRRQAVDRHDSPNGDAQLPGVRGGSPARPMHRCSDWRQLPCRHRPTDALYAQLRHNARVERRRTKRAPLTPAKPVPVFVALFVHLPVFLALFVHLLLPKPAR